MIQKEGKGSRFAVVWLVLSLLGGCCEVRREVCQQGGPEENTPSPLAPAARGKRLQSGPGM